LLLLFYQFKFSYHYAIFARSIIGAVSALWKNLPNLANGHIEKGEKEVEGGRPEEETQTKKPVKRAKIPKIEDGERGGLKRKWIQKIKEKIIF
jgi:hypothetical protein